MTSPEQIDGNREPDLYVVPDDRNGERVDVYLNDVTRWNSRGRVKESIKLGGVLVNGSRIKPSHRLRRGDRVEVSGEAPTPPDYLLPEDIPLSILHEDASMLVLDKPAFLTVHPGAGHATGTMANALAHHFRELSDVAGPMRPGIVHRLDRETSGVICVAKTNRAHYSITTQFQERTVEKTYVAIVEGRMEYDEYKVDEPIGRHPGHPTKMAIVEHGRPAFTRVEVVERMNAISLVRCFPKSGRTHQIRVHLASLGHPVICDKHYGRRPRMRRSDLASLSPDDPNDPTLIERQALHARTLTLTHPMLGTRITFEAPLHADMASVLELARETNKRS